MKMLLASTTVIAMAALGGVALAQGPAAAPSAEDLPPNAMPGHCYGKLLVPVQYETYTEQVLDTAARTESHVTPAITADETQQVLATEARTEYETIPATYRTVTETVVVKPASSHKVTVPAVYGQETEQILVREAHTVWKRGDRSPNDIVVPGTTKVLATGEVLCLVQVPAEYRTITRQVVRTPETTRDVPDPAVTTTVTHQVIDRPAQVIPHQIPATYKTITVTKVVTPERVDTITIPATYRTLTKQRVTAPSHFAWTEVQCEPEADATPQVRLGEAAPAAPPPAAARPTRPSSAPAPRVSSQTITQSSLTTRTVTRADALVSVSTLAAGGDARTQALQAALKSRGYYNGPLSGRFTAATQLAMVRFQRDNNLGRGTFDRSTAHALGLAG